jgi:hypothetical protein
MRLRSVPPPPYSDIVVTPLPSPRRCWTLVHDADTGEWEAATFETREALAVALPLPAPRWADGEWEIDPVAPPLLLTWAPDQTGTGALWIPEQSVYWSKADAAEAARYRTVEARAARRAVRGRP